jgi:3'-phosphoadenosine 5'-phosphosulfate sulfotransferase (PAPS reductase)/FAD synthetase
MFNISFSGGMGSAISALAAHKHGLPFRLIFADTHMEDPDLYRFIDDVARATDHPVIYLSDGRTPWDVFEARKFIGNTRTAHCSSMLKTDVVRAWLDEHSPIDEPLVLGMDWSEMDRIERARKVWEPRPVVSLLNDLKVTRPTYARYLAEYNIKEPRLYNLGFPHNNCGGACVKQGLAGWATLLEKLPAVFEAAETRMEQAMATIGPTARPFLRKTINGVTTYLTLREFRERYQAGDIKIDPYEDGAGSCGCFTDTPDVT